MSRQGRKRMGICLLMAFITLELALTSGVEVGWAKDRSDLRLIRKDLIVGTWECDGGPPPFKVVKNFEAGGTMMEIDNITTQESPTIGRWKKTEDLKYCLSARQFTYDTSGNWLGTYHYTQPLTMDPSLNSMKGTFHFELIDPNGNVISSGDGEVSCKRMPF